MHDFRLQPIMEMVDSVVVVHGYELLAGASQCPKWTHAQWVDWYEQLPAVLRERVPACERIFFNVDSEQACDPRIVYAINEAVAHRQCVIEWTENFAAQSTYERALWQFRAWRDAGIDIAIDDIGTGQDGIGRALSVLPRYAKIGSVILQRSRSAPQSFLRELRNVLEGIGCRVIAEGIETLDDLALAKAAGFRYTQGFLHAPTKHPLRHQTPNGVNYPAIKGGARLANLDT